MKTTEKKQESGWVGIPESRAFCSILEKLDDQIQDELDFWATYEGKDDWTNENGLLSALELVACKLCLPDDLFNPADMIAKIREENEEALKVEGQMLYDSVTEDFNRAKGIK